MRMGLWSVGLMGVLAACGVAGLAQEHGLATAPATMPAREPLEGLLHGSLPMPVLVPSPWEPSCRRPARAARAP